MEFLLQLILERRSREIIPRLSSFYLRNKFISGYFYDPASQAAISAIKYFSNFCSGTVYVKLYKGNILYGKN